MASSRMDAIVRYGGRSARQKCPLHCASAKVGEGSPLDTKRPLTKSRLETESHAAPAADPAHLLSLDLRIAALESLIGSDSKTLTAPLQVICFRQLNAA